jgi:hypothetical protein
MVAVDQSRQLGRKTWAVSLRISRSAGRLFGVIEAPELISFDCLHCYFLTIVLVMFQALSDTQCEKAEIRQRIAFNIYGSLHSRMRIDMPSDGVHDRVWCSPFELVLATNLLPKDNGHTRS